MQPNTFSHYKYLLCTSISTSFEITMKLSKHLKIIKTSESEDSMQNYFSSLCSIYILLSQIGV